LRAGTDALARCAPGRSSRFASHWLLSGGSIEKLKEIPGHCSVVMTERYAHLRLDLWGGIAGRNIP
jgi:site-specific recombinase XerC